MLSESEFSRLRWRCRRGLLENDLVLSRLLERRGPAFSTDEHQQLLALLSLDDTLLWDLIAGRCDDAPPGSEPMLAELRSTLQNP